MFSRIYIIYFFISNVCCRKIFTFWINLIFFFFNVEDHFICVLGSISKYKITFSPGVSIHNLFDDDEMFWVWVIIMFSILILELKIDRPPILKWMIC